MSKQIFLPEALYGIDSEMTYNKLYIYYKTNTSVTCKVLRSDSKNQLLEVDLGGNLTGIIPFELSTIYQIYNGTSLSPNIFSLVGKNVRAKIQKFDFENNTIILSRKESMLEAFEILKDTTQIDFAVITGFSKSSAFVDIGAGITGKSTEKAFSSIIFNNIEEIGINKGDIISVTVLSCDEETKRFELSRVDALPQINNFLSRDDHILCTVLAPIDSEKTGYFVSIDKNNFKGIVDSPYEELFPGDKIVAIIKRNTLKGTKLNLVEKI